MDLEFRDRVALVTGGSRGIGASIVYALARQGADVAFNHWEDPEGAREVRTGLQVFGRRTLALEADVSRFEEAVRVVERVHKDLGRLDILVCNAGVASDRLSWDMAESQWDRVIDVNLKGTFNYCRAAGRIFMEQRHGKIVTVSSISGLRGKAGQANYAASKGGIIALTKTLARELGRYNVNVNSVAPGMVATESVRDLPEEFVNSAESESALGRIASAEDVASVVLFLCSEGARHVTGECVRVDGGQYI